MIDNRKWPPKPDTAISLNLWEIALKFQRQISGIRPSKARKNVSASDCNSDRQPEIAIRPPKPEILISLELWQTASSFQRQIRHFRPYRTRQKCSHVIATTTDSRKRQDWRPVRLHCHFRLSIDIAIARWQFLRAQHGRKRKPQIYLWNFGRVCHGSGDINISGFSSHFRLSVTIGIAWKHFLRAGIGRKFQVRRWNFDDICHIFECRSTSGLSSHIAISDVYPCHLLLWTLSLNFPR